LENSTATDITLLSDIIYIKARYTTCKLRKLGKHHEDQIGAVALAGGAGVVAGVGGAGAGVVVVVPTVHVTAQPALGPRFVPAVPSVEADAVVTNASEKNLMLAF